MFKKRDNLACLSITQKTSLEESTVVIYDNDDRTTIGRGPSKSTLQNFQELSGSLVGGTLEPTY